MLQTEELTPRKIVEELDHYIIGQRDAKRAVAVALRNRYRRSQLPDDLRDEVIPKNILMIGPTGVGKTEIARRLARLVGAPFIKVEATKYTEVGYVGRDVESMVRDLVENAVRMEENLRLEEVKERADALAVRRIIEILDPRLRKKEPSANPFAMIFGGAQAQAPPVEPSPADPDREAQETEDLRQAVAEGRLDDHELEIEIEEGFPQFVEVFHGSGMEEMGINFQDILGGLMPKRHKKRRVKVAEARKILAFEEARKLIDIEEVKRRALERVEQSGIIFLDELDKIAGREKGHGPDVSREGVQRDILPIVEGSTITTKHGPVKTDHILFIAAGAFHVSRPSDLIPELQGRFPIRVELQALTRDDFRRILTEPDNALTRQYQALLNTEGIELEYSEDGLEEIARLAEHVNSQTENIGARRLQTIMEKVLEDLAFDAPEVESTLVRVDRDYVRSRLEKIVKDEDLSRFIL